VFVELLQYELRWWLTFVSALLVLCLLNTVDLALDEKTRISCWTAARCYDCGMMVPYNIFVHIVKKERPISSVVNANKMHGCGNHFNPMSN